MAKIDIKNLPRPVKIAVAVLPGIAIMATMFFVAVKPKFAVIEKLKGEIATQEQDISKSQNMAAKLGELKVENDRLKAELKALEAFLPAEKEISSLLRQIEELVVESELQLISWNPAEKRKHSSGIVYEVPVSMTLNGSYHNLGNFFGRLTKIDRIVNISNISLTGPQQKGAVATLSISFAAVTFTAVEEAK